MPDSKLYRINKIEEILNAYLRIKLEAYQDLQNFIEDNLSNIQNELDDKWNELDELILSESSELLYEEIAGDLWKFKHEFPNRIRYSAIIQTYSVLEVYMKWLCERLGQLRNSKFSMSDLKGNSDLEKAKLFLKRLYKIDFAKLQPEWGFINDMRRLRNHLIHKNGKIRTKDFDVIKIIDRYTDLGIMLEEGTEEMKDDGEYEVFVSDKKLNQQFSSTTMSFFKKVMNHVKESEKNV